MKTESKRQLQVASLLKQNFSTVLMQEGNYIYGIQPLVTVTTVKVTSDMGLARIYMSVYNTEEKQAVILLMEQEVSRLKYLLGNRVKKHLRRIPDIEFYLDDTLDEMERVNMIFNRLEDENQMGSPDDAEASEDSYEED